MNILITGIGGLTPRSIAKHIRKLYPDYRIIGIDINHRALGFYMNGLIDAGYLAPRADSESYWPFVLDLIEEETIDLAFVQPELEVVEWGNYYYEKGRYPCPVLIPPYNLSKSLMDKSTMADILERTEFIPKTIKVTQDNPRFDDVENTIGFPCWIRATKGSGGLGSLKIKDIGNYKAWLFINEEINEFTISEYLPGRHLATQMLYIDGEYIKGASLECVEYVMADLVPSKITGNTSFGRFLNDESIINLCCDCMDFVREKLQIKPHGVLSFDLKEDKNGNLKVTEVNIRHMAYTAIMASVGFDLISDTLNYLKDSNINNIKKAPFFKYDKPYVFLRDVDIEPVILANESDLLII